MLRPRNKDVERDREVRERGMRERHTNERRGRE